MVDNNFVLLPNVKYIQMLLRPLLLASAPFFS